MPTDVQKAHPTVPIATAVILQGRETAGPFLVDELSPFAAEFRGHSLGNVALGSCTVVLSVPGVPQMLNLAALVTYADWQDGYCTHVSLRFPDLEPDLEDQIQEAMADYVQRSRMPMIVVLDGGELEALGTRRLLHSLGREALFAENSLDALWLLERYRESYATILIDDSFLRASGAQILPFLHDRYMDKRRVVIVPKARDERRASLQGMGFSVHGVLARPWATEEFEAAIGLFPAQREVLARRILFVDDEPAVLSGLQHRLRRHLGNYETVWVTSGEVALAESQARPFDVVVTDLRMPGMDGVRLLAEIRAHSPRSKRIILSGCETHAAADVADVILTKPCPVDRLRAEVT